jgi:hypothetical protein
MKKEISVKLNGLHRNLWIKNFGFYFSENLFPIPLFITTEGEGTR